MKYASFLFRNRRKVARTKLALVIAIFPALINCKKRHGSSEVKTGSRATAQLDSTFLAARPGDTIAFCGDDEIATELITAFKMWAGSLYRAEDFKLIKSCQANQAISYVVRLDINSAESACKDKSILGFVDDFAGQEKTIHICGTPSGAQLKSLIRHEMGHYWGACDQYGVNGSCKMGKNCEVLDGSKTGEDSLMNAINARAPRLDITPADRTSVLVMASRRDLDFNQLWREDFSESYDLANANDKNLRVRINFAQESNKSVAALRLYNDGNTEDVSTLYANSESQDRFEGLSKRGQVTLEKSGNTCVVTYKGGAWPWSSGENKFFGVCTPPSQKEFNIQGQCQCDVTCSTYNDLSRTLKDRFETTVSQATSAAECHRDFLRESVIIACARKSKASHKAYHIDVTHCEFSGLEASQLKEASKEARNEE